MPFFLLVFHNNPEWVGSGNGDEVKGAYDLQDIISSALDHAFRYAFMDVIDLRNRQERLSYTVNLEEVKNTLEEMFREWESEQECRREPLRN